MTTRRPSPPKKPPPTPAIDDDVDGSKTVKLSAVELRQQLQELGVDLDADEAPDAESE